MHRALAWSVNKTYSVKEWGMTGTRYRSQKQSVSCFLKHLPEMSINSLSAGCFCFYWFREVLLLSSSYGEVGTYCTRQYYVSLGQEDAVSNPTFSKDHVRYIVSWPYFDQWQPQCCHILLLASCSSPFFLHRVIISHFPVIHILTYFQCFVICDVFFCKYWLMCQLLEWPLAQVKKCSSFGTGWRHCSSCFRSVMWLSRTLCNGWRPSCSAWLTLSPLGEISKSRYVREMGRAHECAFSHPRTVTAWMSVCLRYRLTAQSELALHSCRYANNALGSL